MDSSRLVPFLCAASLLLPAAPAAAQPSEVFAAAFESFAAAATRGDDTRALTGTIDGLEAALVQWDAVIAKMEAGLAAEIGRAPRPAAARMRATLGTAYLERGRRTDALRELDLAVALEPELAVVHTLRAAALEELNRPREAREAYTRAWQHGGDAATAYQFVRAARRAPAPGTAALTAARTAVIDAVTRTLEGPQEPPQFPALRPLGHLTFSPPYSPAAYAAAVAIVADRRFAEGVAALRRALGDPQVQGRERDERTRLSGVDPLIASGDAPAAARALQAAAGAIPNSGRAWHRLGLLLEQLGDPAGAVRALEAARKVGEISAVNEALGRLYHNQLDLDAAAAAYERALGVPPQAGGAHVALAMVYRDMARFDEAMVEFAIAALLDRNDGRPFAELGQMHAATGDDARAVPLLRYALGRAPDLLAARYALSRALLRLGQADEAARELDLFQQQQQKAMAAERQRFEENSRKIDEVLKGDAGTSPK